MTDAIICDRCDARIDETYTGPMFRITNKTGTGGPLKWDLCPECHTEVRDDLWDLVGYEPINSTDDAQTCDGCGATFTPDAATVHDWDQDQNEHCPDCGTIVRGPARRER